MPRVLVLTDRPPNDPEWKGTHAWQIIMGLAESQHEVLVVTPENLASITVTHPRLVVTRPLTNWSVINMRSLVSTIVKFKPNVIHTFALKPSSLWPTLSVWPFLTTACQIMPGLRRIYSVFDDEDWRTPVSYQTWRDSSDQFTVFSPELQAKIQNQTRRPVEILPLDVRGVAANPTAEVISPESNVVIIPAPVSEWETPLHGLARLKFFLDKHNLLNAKIIGGWGNFKSSQRRAGWKQLGEVGARVHMTHPSDLDDFHQLISASHSVWAEPLALQSFRLTMSIHLSQLNQKIIHTQHKDQVSLRVGGTANSISRIYSRN